MARQIASYKISIIIAVLCVFALFIAFLSINLSTTGKAIALKPCIDSDGGKNYSLKGTTTACANPFPCLFRPSSTDSCSSATRLNEYYCYNDAKQSSLYDCPYGCLNGACKTLPACIDSDSGLNYTVKGNTTGVVSCTNQSNCLTPTTVPDSCTNSTRLNEYYCINGFRYVSLYDCPNGCVNGTCRTDATCAAKRGNICESYEVCDGKVLSSIDSYQCCNGQCKLPKLFDWRNRHGENWNSPVKNQGIVGTCEKFAIIGMIESYANLYFNQHLDINLSEQQMEDCDNIYLGSYSGCYNLDIPWDCSNINSLYCAIAKEGLVDEACYPYNPERFWIIDPLNPDHMQPNPYGDCDMKYKCQGWQNRTWKISDAILYKYSDRGLENCPDKEIFNARDDDIKLALITYGPLKGRAQSTVTFSDGFTDIMNGHSMTMVGYQEKSDGLYWIFKNSGGESAAHSDNGYFSLKLEKSFETMDFVMALNGPIYPPVNSKYQILCLDKDNDSFCNWGITKDRPSTCPSFCKPVPDWDDSDSSIGALGIY